MGRRRVLIDVLVAAAAFSISALVLNGSHPAEERAPDVVAYALVALYSGSIVLRRFMPVVAVLTGLLAGLAYAAADYPVALVPVVLLSVYTAAAELPQRRAQQVLAGSVAIGLLSATFGPGPTDLGVPALIVSAWLLGNYVGSRRAYTAELEAQNRLLRAARLELADQALADERLRIARELHDVVAHSMSVVALHAGTGRMVAEENPAAARDALATIETATRSALLEMRRMLGVLRGSDGEQRDQLAPVPGLADLDALVAQVVRSGTTVEVHIDGSRRSVPAGVDLSAYRIVQEALTNVMKHAPGARAIVTVHYDDHAVTVGIDNEGEHTRVNPPSATVRLGHGLTGMRERVALYHGDLVANFGPDGGFHVRARLPYAGGS